MTQVAFGVSASSFIANMCVKQNAIDHVLQYPLAARAVNDSFYVDYEPTGADSIEEAIKLHHQLQSMFSLAGFLLRKWNSSESEVLQVIDPELRDSRSVQQISDQGAEYTKTLGIEWNVSQDHFRLAVADLSPLEPLTKQAFVSDIAKTFDVLGWFAPAIVHVKISECGKRKSDGTIQYHQSFNNSDHSGERNCISSQLDTYPDAITRKRSGLHQRKYTDSLMRLNWPMPGWFI